MESKKKMKHQMLKRQKEKANQPHKRMKMLLRGREVGQKIVS